MVSICQSLRRDQEQKAEREKKDAEAKAKRERDLSNAAANADQRLRGIERKADVSDFITSEDGKLFKQYSEQLRKAAADPRFYNVPVSQLPQLILKPSAYAKVLSDARDRADSEARDSVSGGSGKKSMVPDEVQKLDPKNMGKEDFDKLKQDALRGKFRIKNE